MTAYSKISTLRFDEANVSLGDELRALRASHGKSVEDVERDLRIKSNYIEAIESTDLSALPEKVYADGFVKNYARYLGLDPDDVLRRFNDEAGFISQAKGESAGALQPTDRAVESLAAFERRKRSNEEGGLGRAFAALWPLAVLIGLGAGLWYGVKAAREAGMVPQELNVFGAAPGEDSVIEANIADDALGASPDAPAERPGTLAYAEIGTAPYWSEAEAEPLDGPIEDVDTATEGVFAEEPQAEAIVLARAEPASESAPQIDAREIAAEARAALLDPEAGAAPVATATDSDRFALIAKADTWIEVRDASGVAFSGILGEGDNFEIPDGSAGLQVKIGNAGGLFVTIDGQQLGPFGASGAVLRNVSLDRDVLRERLPVVE